jgi:hypothetical protein
LRGPTFDDVNWRGEVVFDAINRKSRIRVEAANVAVVCPFVQDNISAIPVFRPEDDIFIG